MKALSDEDLRTSEKEVVEISFPGSVDFVVIARFTAATIAARAGFDLDDIDDLRLAVDELSISFGPLDTESCLRYEFVRDGDSVTVRFTASRRRAAGTAAAEGAERTRRSPHATWRTGCRRASSPPCFSTNSSPRMAARSTRDAPWRG